MPWRRTLFVCLGSCISTEKRLPFLCLCNPSFSSFPSLSMTMSNAYTKEVLWQEDGLTENHKTEELDGFVASSLLSHFLSLFLFLFFALIAYIPAKILDCEAVNRSITFHSSLERSQLSLIQSVYLEMPGRSPGDEDELVLLEEWVFDFGFVIPNSTNTWDQVIESRKRKEMGEIGEEDDDLMLSPSPPPPFDPLQFSGHIIMDTLFKDGEEEEVLRVKVRLFYT